MQWSWIVLAAGVTLSLVLHLAAYLWPPRTSFRGFKQRLAELEVAHEGLDAKHLRLKRRHYALEGFVYRSADEDDEDVSETPAAPASAHQAGPLVPDSGPGGPGWDDEAELRFQEAQQRNRVIHGPPIPGREYFGGNGG